MTQITQSTRLYNFSKILYFIGLTLLVVLAPLLLFDSTVASTISLVLNLFFLGLSFFSKSQRPHLWLSRKRLFDLVLFNARYEKSSCLEAMAKDDAAGWPPQLWRDIRLTCSRYFQYFLGSVVLVLVGFAGNSSGYLSPSVDGAVTLKIQYGDDTIHHKSLPHQTVEAQAVRASLLKIIWEVKGPLEEAPYLKIRSQDHVQEFAFHRSADHFAVEFSLQHNAELLIPILSSQTLFEVEVEDAIGPEAQLVVMAAQTDKPWFDKNPLPISYQVTSTTPLDAIDLKIQKGEEIFTREMTQFETGDIFQYMDSLEMDLSYYSEDQVISVTLWVEARDKSKPFQLKGTSNVVSLKLINEYGLYLQSLDQMQAVRKILADDKAFEKAGEVRETWQEAKSSVASSSFFSNYDRMFLRKLETEIFKAYELKDSLSQLEAHENLSDFLSVHENLNARERDADFFVAARALSAAIGKKPEEKIRSSAENLDEFVQERAKIWDIRIDRLEEPFLSQVIPRQVEQILNLSQDYQNAPLDQSKLLQLSETYRNWTQQLEKAEDEQFAHKQKQMQETLEENDEALKWMQKEQDMISMDLEDSLKDQVLTDEIRQDYDGRQEKILDKIEETIAKVGNSVPVLGKRLRAAKGSMKSVQSALQDDDLADAEAHSDMAARLLRHAQKTNQQQMEQLRRNRQSSGDYFGKELTPYDLDLSGKEYEVDERYREDLMDQINSLDSPADEQEVKEYIRSVIR